MNLKTWKDETSHDMVIELRIRESDLLAPGAAQDWKAFSNSVATSKICLSRDLRLLAVIADRLEMEYVRREDRRRQYEELKKEFGE